MTSKNVILTGFMGTGKSSAGRVLARRLGYEFIDTDEFIEAQQNRSIAQIFAEDGEPAFRQMETAAAHELAQRERLVIATGGRLMLNPENAAALSATGEVFCLSAEPADIIKRLSSTNARNKRPLLHNVKLEEYVPKLLAERKSAYAQFQQIDTSNRLPYQVANVIYRQLKPKIKKLGQVN